MDQLSELNAIVATNPYYDAQGATFTIAGDFVPPDGSRIFNLNLVQLDPTATRRTIKKIGGADVLMRNITIDMGDDKTAGTIADAAGAWISGVSGLDIDGLEVKGDGAGSRIRLIGMDRPKLANLHAHSGVAQFTSAPTSEQIIGIFLEGISRATIAGLRAENLYVEHGGNTRCYQTDGMTLAGCSDLTLLGPQGSNVGEGIDITGSVGNTRIAMMGGNFTDCDSFGVKWANSASGCTAHGTTAKGSGFCNFVISGPSVSGLPVIENNVLVGCISIDPGNAYWDVGNANICGFAIMNNSQVLPTTPRNNLLVSCIANETRSGSARRMKYGFRNENSNTANKLLANCMSIGHTVAATNGTWG